MMQRRAFDVFADYHQFYLWDRGMTDQAPDEYSEEDCRRRIKTGPYVVVIQPLRNMTVPVVVEIHEHDPGYDAVSWDHFVEASLHLPTGELQVHECTGGPVAEFAVPAGWYRVRSLSGGFATVSGIEGNDHYRVVLWPEPPGDVLVVRQWVPSK